jgi:hypothetical protein
MVIALTLAASDVLSTFFFLRLSSCFFKLMSRLHNAQMVAPNASFIPHLRHLLPATVVPAIGVGTLEFVGDDRSDPAAPTASVWLLREEEIAECFGFLILFHHTMRWRLRHD